MPAGRATGRRLNEFSPLKKTEENILDAAKSGRTAVIGETMPEAEDDSITVRAEFLRFLALGGDDSAPVHEKGVWVQGAWISGTLDLSCTEIAGSLVLTQCRFETDLALFDAQIRGLFSLEGSHVPGMKADRLHCRSGVFLRKGFTSRGEIRLLGADIGSNLDCQGGKFGSKNSWAINGERMTVSGAFVFDHVTIDSGVVTLHAAHVGLLVDDLASWPQNSVLDGFVYDHFAGHAPTDAKARLAWLDKQSSAHSGKAKNPREFRPQPWLQLRKVLREQGHLEDARQVAVAFENRKRACGVIGEISGPATPGKRITWLGQKLARYTARGFHFLYGALIGYGYRPLRLLGIVALVWIFCTGLFYVGANNRVFGPTDPKLSENPAYDSCNPEKNPAANWTRCKTLPRAYPAFYPPLYALDVLLPIAKLGQQDHWAPLNPARENIFSRRALAWVTQIVVWLETLFGWIAGLLLVATVTGLAKRHED